MNREQKAATIEALTTQIEQSDAIFAVDYRGISVPQVAELRSKLTEADATFRVVKNSLTQLAAERAGADALKELLQGPTALTFVRGDSAVAAKAIADYARVTQLLPFKGGMLGSEALAPEQITAISRLPSREALYGQLVGMVAAPVSGLVRTLGALIGGLAVALGQVQEKKESGEIPAGAAPAEPETVGAQAEADREPQADADPGAQAEADPEPQASTEPAPETATDDNQTEPAAGDQSQDSAATKED